MTEPTAPTTEAPPLTRDQATAMVGKHLLGALEDVITAHELVLADEAKSESRKADARLVIAAAQAFGRPLFVLVKAAEKPRILRIQRSLHIAR